MSTEYENLNAWIKYAESCESCGSKPLCYEEWLNSLRQACADAGVNSLGPAIEDPTDLIEIDLDEEVTVVD